MQAEDIPPPVVRNGVDVVLAERCAALRHQRLALVTNHSGLTNEGRRTIDVLLENPDVYLEKLFSPEHGLSGNQDERLPDSVDQPTGLAVHSLFGYGDVYKPTQLQLHGLDAVIYDIQDVGCRFYTYVSTLGYVMEACAENGVGVYVLDRPNPIGGLDVEGPCSDAEHESFVAFHPLPLRHGMTIGEMAVFLNRERNIGAKLSVVTMAGWRREAWFGDTGQRWVNPSPNIRDVAGAALYPGVGLLENTNVSVGRGTLRPFHVLGAPWIDSKGLSAALYGAELPGLRYQAVTFVPNDARHRFNGETCHGVRFFVDDINALEPARLGLALIRSLRAQHREVWEHRGLEALLARSDLLEAIEDESSELDDLWQPDPDFFEARARALLY